MKISAFRLMQLERLRHKQPEYLVRSRKTASNTWHRGCVIVFDTSKVPLTDTSLLSIILLCIFFSHLLSVHSQIWVIVNKCGFWHFHGLSWQMKMKINPVFNPPQNSCVLLVSNWAVHGCSLAVIIYSFLSKDSFQRTGHPRCCLTKLSSCKTLVEPTC